MSIEDQINKYYEKGIAPYKRPIQHIKDVAQNPKEAENFKNFLENNKTNYDEIKKENNNEILKAKIEKPDEER